MVVQDFQCHLGPNSCPHYKIRDPILFFSFFKFIFYCYSITVVCLFSPSLPPPQLNPPPSPTPTIPPDFVHVSFIIVPAIPSSHCPHPTPPWPLLDCSPPQCLWLYFACSFPLLIMFQLKVRSYGICPSPPGLFHLA